jgi:hypothetical protein
MRQEVVLLRVINHNQNIIHTLANFSAKLVG